MTKKGHTFPASSTPLPEDPTGKRDPAENISRPSRPVWPKRFDSAQPFTPGTAVTGLTEAERAAELLRALAHRVVQVQETERGRVALELHNHITQPLVGVLFSSQALAAQLSTRNDYAKRAAIQLRELVGVISREVERISRELRPGVLKELGLNAVLRTVSREFTTRTGVPVELASRPLAERLPPDMELALYRILEEALKNTEQHARARHVVVELAQSAEAVQLIIRDDGVGFNARQHAARRKTKRVLGLLGMQERASYVGGTLTVKSAPRAGTEIVARIPLLPGTAGGSLAA